MRPGVEWLRSRKIPGSLAILSFFILVFGLFALFFWLAVPPALHELKRALAQPVSGTAAAHSTGIRHDVLVFGHDPPQAPPARRLRGRRATPVS